MAAPHPDANIEISDAESLNLTSDTSLTEESITNNRVTTIVDDASTSQSTDATELASSKDCLQVTGDGDIIMDEENSEIIKRKKLSLTLPLLNVVDTAGASHTSGDASAIEAATSSCKTKKMLESDDTFIQTIFSQTIKSTTVTPTDDDPSYAFEDFHGTRIRGSISSQQTKSDSLLTDDTPVEKLEMPIDGMSPETIAKMSFFDKRLSETSEILQLDGNSPPTSDDKPAETFAYFHQTIDEDEVDVEGVVAAAAGDVDNDSPADACLDEFIDSPHETQTNIESLTNALLEPALQSPSVHCDTDECPNVNDNNNTNASNAQQGNDASEQINAADAISSYDDEHTETEQNNTLTSTNSSLHVSSPLVFQIALLPLFYSHLPILCCVEL